MFRLPQAFANKTVAILPITRLVFDLPFKIGSYYFFPAGEFDVLALNPIPPLSLDDCRVDSELIKLEGKNLRRAKSAIAGLSIEVLESNPLIVFTTDIDWATFGELDHDGDIEIIQSLSSKAEKALNVIRFSCCRFDLPDTLPGLAGSWDGSGQFLGALIYNSSRYASHLISGGAVESTVIVKGLGLQVDGFLQVELPNPESGELFAIASHALLLFSDVMYASNETTKFVRAMTLLEFLGSPDKYKTWKELKSEIICHFAKDKTDYYRLIERFKELTSKKNDNDIQSGLRTLIVHQGKFLHELIPDPRARKQLFKEIQGYAKSVIQDMLFHGESSWGSFMAYRYSLKERLGVA
ncbi:MAG: hypothetical protein Q8O79_06440 [Pseudomonadota bacterium]|nr:hypothetical protein [Pseudomonadota bacterium]